MYFVNYILEDVWSMVKDAHIFYFSGYFLTTSDGVDTMATVAEHAMKSKQVTVSININYYWHIFS